MSYHVGDVAVLQGTFTNTGTGSLVDPTSITMAVRAPDGTKTTPSPSKISTGVYQYNLPLTEPGVWRWRMVSTGTGQAANQSDLNVTENSF